jgi:capsid protein
METAAKIDRYKEATVGTAEENAKLVYSIEHDQNSDGSNPLIKNLAQSMGRNNGTAPETDPQTAGENVATKIALSTEKQVFNMPIGAKINQHGGKVDIHFGEFFSTNADLIYATLGIPPEVAMDKFGGAYSGSRAALKSWEYKMAVDRITLLDRQFYKPFYSYWLDIQVLSNKITVPGYLEAMLKKDYTKIEAYKNVRFVGAGVPHIDPLKEVNAERKKLGSIYDNVPLTTGDNSAETLGTGDFESILEQAARERELFSEFENTNENENGL